jgi:DNA-binding MarR family transcriptional regulator
MSQVHDDVDALTSPLVYEAMNRTFELGARLNNVIEHGLDSMGLTMARATLLWHVHHRGPLTQRELSQALNVTPRNVTGLVDALEATGFVVRAPHPTDRRATLITLTEQGRKSASVRDGEYQGFAASMFGDVPPDQLELFIDVVDHVLARLRAGDSGPAPAGGATTIDIVPDGTCTP